MAWPYDTAPPSWVPLENAACTVAHIWPTATKEDLEQALRSLSAAAALYVADRCIERSADVAREIADATYSAWWLSEAWPNGDTRRAMKPIHAARAEMDALHSLRDRFAGVIRSLIAQGTDSREAIETGTEGKSAVNLVERLTRERNQALSEVIVLKDANKLVGPWFSGALDDPGVCEEMKVAIRYWFNALTPTPTEGQRG